MLIPDEILYALHRDLVTAEDLTELIEAKPNDLELVLTGGHTEPTAILDHDDPVTDSDYWDCVRDQVTTIGVSGPVPNILDQHGGNGSQ